MMFLTAFRFVLRSEWNLLELTHLFTGNLKQKREDEDKEPA